MLGFPEHKSFMLGANVPKRKQLSIVPIPDSCLHMLLSCNSVIPSDRLKIKQWKMDEIIATLGFIFSCLGLVRNIGSIISLDYAMEPTTSASCVCFGAAKYCCESMVINAILLHGLSRNSREYLVPFVFAHVVHMIHMLVSNTVFNAIILPI